MKNNTSIFDIKNLEKIDKSILDKYPILKYRINNVINKIDVRGLNDNDSHRCGLMLDDSVICGDFHYPCVIYFREGGNPVGKVGPNMRQERYEWIKNNDTHFDPICKKNCLDVCKEYNIKYDQYHG